MKIGLLLVSIVLLTVAVAVADTWEHTFGNDLSEQAFFTLAAEDGGFLICGIFIIDESYSITSSESAGGVDCMLFRIDDNQEILWEIDDYHNTQSLHCVLLHEIRFSSVTCSLMVWNNRSVLHG